MAEKSEREIDHTITRNIPRLAKYGVLTVRPGYEITGHQLTGRRAVVTTVHTKKPLAELAPSEKLPDRIGGVPVDVREARPYQRLRAADPLAAELSQRYSRPEDAEPESSPAPRPRWSSACTTSRRLRSSSRSSRTSRRRRRCSWCSTTRRPTRRATRSTRSRSPTSGRRSAPAPTPPGRSPGPTISPPNGRSPTPITSRSSCATTAPCGSRAAT